MKMICMDWQTDSQWYRSVSTVPAIQIGILPTYGQTDRRVKYCILAVGDLKMSQKVAQIACYRLLDQQDQ